MTLIHHPAFQSLGLPLVLALALTFVMTRGPTLAGSRWWAMGASLALLLSWLLLPGYDWPATARTQKLPWVALAGTALAAAWLLLGASGPGRWTRWATGSGLWAMACVWLTGDPAQWAYTLPGALVGAALLALMLVAIPDNPRKPLVGTGGGDRAVPVQGGLHLSAALAVAALGLAASAAGGGSLLVAQLAMMLAVVTAVAGLWAWLRSGSGMRIAPSALFPLAMAWLGIAHSLAVSSPSASGRMAVMALAFAAPALLSRSSWAVRHPRWAPLLAAVLAAIPVAVALAWLLLGDTVSAGTDGAVGDAEDDPYYQPDWE